MADSILTLGDAVTGLYDTAVVSKAATSTKRLDGLAEHCVQQLGIRVLTQAETEVDLPGGARTKKWDVTWSLRGKCRLAISLKSILRNLPGTVPNRLDDLMGEVTNVQMYSPEVVVGYLMLLDVSQDRHSPKHGDTWANYLRARLSGIVGRSAPAWGFGMVEAACVVSVGFSGEPAVLTPESDVADFFDALATQVKLRNPSIA